MSNEKIVHDDCEQHDCPVPTDRRRFLRESVIGVASALIAVGMNGTAAFAMPLEFTGATRSARSMRSYAVPLADGAQIDKDNDVILVRWQDAIYAFTLSCPHQNTALKWEQRDAQFQCPKHHSRYRPDGSFIEGRATRGMDRFGVRRDGEKVVVDLDKLYQQDSDPAEWKAAVISL